MILIVESDDSTRKLLVLFLKDIDPKCIGLSDADGAIEWLSKNKPDMLIIDFRINDETALPVIQSCKNHYPAARIILMSAMYGWQLKKIADTLNVSYLTKPFVLDDLEKMAKPSQNDYTKLAN